MTIDGEGRVRIIDRARDLVESGGVWTRSVDLETALRAQLEEFELEGTQGRRARGEEAP